MGAILLWDHASSGTIEQLSRIIIGVMQANAAPQFDDGPAQFDRSFAADAGTGPGQETFGESRARRTRASYTDHVHKWIDAKET